MSPADSSSMVAKSPELVYFCNATWPSTMMPIPGQTSPSLAMTSPFHTSRILVLAQYWWKESWPRPANRLVLPSVSQIFFILSLLSGAQTGVWRQLAVLPAIPSAAPPAVAVGRQFRFSQAASHYTVKAYTS